MGASVHRIPSWCRASGAEAADVHAFGRRMNELAHELGRDAREDGGQVYFVGLRLKRYALRVTNWSASLQG